MKLIREETCFRGGMEEEANATHDKRSRTGSLRSERIAAGIEKLVKEYEEQERTSKEVEVEKQVNKEGMVIIDEDGKGSRQWSETSCRNSSTQNCSKQGK